MTQGISFAQKKGTLIALACAAAFAAPQAANAQKETFEILKIEGHPLTLQGNISGGYARNKTTGSAGGASSDGAEKGNIWSGESNVRFSASTKLSDGFVNGVGFQVESGYETSDGSVSVSQGTLASRNTAIGLKTDWGTLFAGRWDTPYKLAMANFYATTASMGLGLSTTGFLGTPGIGTGAFNGAGGNIIGGTATAPTMSFRRRQANSLNYYTPELAGFKAGFMYTPDEETGVGSVTQKATAFGASLAYKRGPLAVQFTMEKHEDYAWGSAVGSRLAGTGNANVGLNTAATAVTAGGVSTAAAGNQVLVGNTSAGGTGGNSSDRALSLGVSYDFGSVQLQGYWERLTYGQTAAPGTTATAGSGLPLTSLSTLGGATGLAGAAGLVNLRGIESNKYLVSGTWNVSGPHTLVGAYGKAMSLSCDATANWTGSCADTGAQIFNFLYRYKLDKVTYINLGYTQLNNDRNGNFVASNSQGATTAASAVGVSATAAATNTVTSSNGHKDSGWTLGVQTSF